MIRKIHVYLIAIFVLTLLGCVENTKSVKSTEAKDSVCVINKNSNTKNEQFELDNINEGDSNMVDISTVFSTEEIDKIRLSYIKQLRYEFQSFDLAEDYTLLPGEDWRLVKRIHEDFEISDEEKSENMDVIYRILLKKYPIFKTVSKELFEKKMEDVFCLDMKDKNVCGSTFYTNHEMINETTYSTYIDLKNHILTYSVLPLLFNEKFNLMGMNEKLKDINRESVEYCEKKEQFYEDFFSEASQKKFTPFCSRSDLERLFHINNYVFYDNKASLSWLLTDDLGKAKLRVLFNFFNYDKEPRINKYIMEVFFKRNDVSKGYPLKTIEYKRIFGEVASCPQTDYYNHFQFKVRTGLMQYIVDNCYDETDLDSFGIRNDKYICVMEDCFDYLMGFVLKGDKYKESEQCHYYQVCAYLAYYLQKAYENFVSQGNCDPRCWHNALVNNLRKDINDNDARFENYVKDNDYFGLEGFEEIMKKAHEEAMMD